MEKEKINLILEKRFMSKIYKALIQFNSKTKRKKRKFKLKNNPIKKMGKAPQWTSFQRRHTNGQQIYENVFNIINQLGNANQNHNELLPHIC